MTPRSEIEAVSELSVRRLVESATVLVTDAACRGTCRHKSEEESCAATQLVFPYRGVYVRHVGAQQTVADGNQMLFFNAAEGYRVSHPIPGGDRNISLIVNESQLRELAPRALLHSGATVAFRYQAVPIDSQTQALAGLLRHRLHRSLLEPLEAESLALTLVERALKPDRSRIPKTSRDRRLVDRIKLLLVSDVSKRWSLSDIGHAVQRSPVYVTQLFRQTEGVPLYQYQLQLRLARALDRLAHYDDLTMLSLDLGFSSHSHFSAAFRRTYGLSPSEFKRSAVRRQRRHAAV